MSQLRKDPVTKRWVIVVNEREFTRTRSPGETFPLYPTELCPFCPGREDGTPPEILSFRDGQNWQVRVVANKFPALQIEGDLNRSGTGVYDRMNGIGAHEVIIEHPDHNASFGTFTARDIEKILWCYRERSIDLRKDRRFKYLLIFKNSGRVAGASLEHTHSQLIATPVIPKRVMEEMTGAHSYHAYKERCVYCDMIRQEEGTGHRVVFENDGFIAVAPFASRFPFEIMVLPKAHSQDFAEISDQGLAQLSQVMRQTIGRLLVSLDNPPYNYIVHTCPVNSPVPEGFHWHIEIIPRMTHVAGFEWGSGFYVNPVPPEEASRRLRECQLDPGDDQSGA
jgi:UDPglucose--hexose-1-phosphate uridylyltransferase